MQNWEIRSVEDFAKAIRTARRSAGLTQRQLALATGTGERFIVELERGKPNARLGLALQVALSLGLGASLTPNQ
jgi:transcriptional regulator with XRE-family HTH domain